MNLHEDIRRKTEIKPVSERAFGLVFAIVFATVGFGSLLLSGRINWWAMMASGLIFFTVLFRSRWFILPNRLFTHVGSLLHHVMSLVTLSLVYYLVVTPTGVLLRLCGQDPLRLRWDRSAKSYWINRDPSERRPESMKHQF